MGRLGGMGGLDGIGGLGGLGGQKVKGRGRPVSSFRLLQTDFGIGDLWLK